MKDILAAKDNVVIKFIPVVPKSAEFRRIRGGRPYHHVKAASFGPGNLDIGLK